MRRFSNEEVFWGVGEGVGVEVGWGGVGWTERQKAKTDRQGESQIGRALISVMLASRGQARKKRIMSGSQQRPQPLICGSA